ncbi:MAG: TIGR04282 family arsenosugar biosynthesis glycosyltransferase [Deltaproteobacteria bacterium]|nr:TIGR04282 family arsenosugar biosynthesis glycosyltransferase [Deltaproteobacteria bacterium]
MKEKGLIVFIRYPEKGRVKTRLAQYLGDDLTLDLYKHFLVDILTMCRMIDAEIMIAYSISEQRKDEVLFFSERYMHFCQKGDDLGQRMFHALCEAAERGCKKCILIGSDIPDLPAAIINNAYNALNSSDITLGPSTDGGYYLIGFCSERIDHRIFNKVKWGTSSVLKDTLENIKKTGMSFFLLQEWSDIDELYTDIDELYTLKRYYSRYKQRKKMFSTMEFLEHNKGIFKE